jgi:hypothetical protein
VYLGFFLVPASFCVALVVIFQALSPSDYFWSTLAIVLGISLLAGALPRFSQRLIVVDAAGLHVGRHLVPPGEITSVRAVSGGELRRLRHEIADVGVASIGLTGAGTLASGLSMMLAGISLIQSEDRRRGMLCSPWQEPALLVETPELPTERWLIAARDPVRLQEAIESCRTTTGADPGPDPPEWDLQSAIAALPRELQPEEGWRPPPREG